MNNCGCEVNQSTGVNEHKSEFVYDGLSRKVISKEFTWTNGAWVQSSETRRIYDGLDVVQERDGSNAVTANYTRSGNIGGILARSTTAGHFYYHYDGSGNVMQLTDSIQATVAEYSYDAYGVLISSSGAQSGQPYRYSTKEYHSATGLYDYGYRFYSPSLGRWINRDPIAENGGLNLYGFVGNNPVNYADPYGLARVELRFRRVIATGLHSFILVWETDAQGRKVGTPRFFGGYNRTRAGVNDGLLHTDYGYYVDRPAGQEDRDYFYCPGRKYANDYFGARLIANDNKPASAYINRFKQVANKIGAARLPYRWYGTNSNATARTILEWGLGIELGGPGVPSWYGDVPGWDRSLLGTGYFD